VVNCVGVYHSDGISIRTVAAVNSLFPHILQQACATEGAAMLHTSTDGVFGVHGPYVESDRRDATDLYGMSKKIGEPEGAMILRTSLVGIGGRHSLLDWVMRQAAGGRRIEGYADCLWNGMTALEYARCCEAVMLGRWEPGVHHVFSEVVSKCDLIRMFAKAAGIGMDIEAVSWPSKRILATERPLNGELGIRRLQEQMDELLAWASPLRPCSEDGR
jgi:dTDP-4-dehydrorhamnose reductase